MSTTKVYYIVPDDGDDETHPNLFSIPMPQHQIKLRDVKQHFPLKRHAYHFRFKKSFQTKFVWLDCIDDNASIPVYEGVLFCKVARLGEAGPSSATRSVSAATTSAATKAPTPSPTTAAPATKQTAKPNIVPDVPFVATFAETEGRLFEWTDIPASNSTATTSTNSAKAAAAAPVHAESDLLDFLGSHNGAPSASPPPVPAGMEDFEWGFPASAPAAAPAASQASLIGGFPGVAPARTISPANSQPQQKKPTTSRIPTELGAEAAKQFTL